MLRLFNKKPELQSAAKPETNKRHLQYNASLVVFDWILDNSKPDKFNITRQELVKKLDGMIISAREIEQANDESLYTDLLKLFGLFFQLFPLLKVKIMYSDPQTIDIEKRKSIERKKLLAECSEVFENCAKHYLGKSLRMSNNFH